MQLSSATLAMATLVAYVQAHGLVTSIQGANGVTMPGLGVIDGTPRDVTGQDARPDVPIFNGNNVLGATKAGGPISAEDGVNQFLNGAAVATNGTAAATSNAAAAKGNPAAKVNAATKGKAAATGNAATGNAATAKGNSVASSNAAAKKKNAETKGNAANTASGGTKNNRRRAALAKQQKKQKQTANQAAGQAQGGSNLAQGTPTPPGTSETIVADTAGQSQLPSVGADGVINLTYHQVNGDGAGPLTASVDPTSGGTQESAFQPASMIAQLPGQNGDDQSGQLTDFKLSIQMPQGMKCTGTVAGQQGVCVVRVTNPKFGGSAVFTQDGSSLASSAGAAADGTATGATNSVSSTTANA